MLEISFFVSTNDGPSKISKEKKISGSDASQPFPGNVLELNSGPGKWFVVTVVKCIRYGK